MAVVTLLEWNDLEEALAPFPVGRIRAFRGLAAGSINTNYEVETELGRWFVRVFEDKSDVEVGFELDLVLHLANAGVPVVAPLLDEGGARWVRVRGKPLAVYRWAAGAIASADGETPLGASRARELGAALAKMHRAAADFGRHRDGRYTFDAVSARLGALEEALPTDDDVRRALPILGDERVFLQRTLEGGAQVARLTGGSIHGDLFPDNVLWEDDRVVALLDFEMAQSGPLVRDLATVLLSWCWDSTGLRRDDARALVTAYTDHQSLGAEDLDPGLWNWARFVAWRYSISRITDFHLSPLSAERLTRKDYRVYLARLMALRATTSAAFASAVGLGSVGNP